ncbi:TPA: glycerophosphodiester phosphodiesterase, partial [Enterococcus faecium]|nr:glycerophosphodiester phosphodiesterase [Enterococcus faecium]
MLQIYAHRGSSGTHPENTLPAFAEAVRVGADGIELDVHLSKDGYLIV